MDVYTIAGFVSSALLILLGLYILKAAPSYSVNRMAAIFAFLATAWCLGESMGDLFLGKNIAFLWGRFAEAGLMWMLPVFVHFTYIFPRPKHLGSRVALIYFPVAFFMSLLIMELFKGEYILLVSPTRIPYTMYQLIFVCFAIFNLARTYVKSRYPTERIQLKLTLIGVVISFSIAVFTMSLNIFFAHNMGRPAVFTIPVSLGVIVYAMMKHRLFIMPPISRFFVPIPEARLKTKQRHELKEGRNYLVKQRGKGPKIFKDLTEHGIPGLWLTTSCPSKIREENGLARTPILHFTPERARGEVTVHPNELNKALDEVYLYLSRAFPRSVVFVDCFRELVLANGFEEAIDFLRKTARLCSRNNSNLIVQIDPTEFSERQLAAIERAVVRS